jgi:hypothetical protein
MLDVGSGVLGRVRHGGRGRGLPADRARCPGPWRTGIGGSRGDADADGVRAWGSRATGAEAPRPDRSPAGEPGRRPGRRAGRVPGPRTGGGTLAKGGLAAKGLGARHARGSERRMVGVEEATMADSEALEAERGRNGAKDCGARPRVRSARAWAALDPALKCDAHPGALHARAIRVGFSPQTVRGRLLLFSFDFLHSSVVNAPSEASLRHTPAEGPGRRRHAPKPRQTARNPPAAVASATVAGHTAAGPAGGMDAAELLGSPRCG